MVKKNKIIIIRKKRNVTGYLLLRETVELILLKKRTENAWGISEQCITIHNIAYPSGPR